MAYTMTQKKRIALAATHRDRATAKTSMLQYQAQRHQSFAAMREAEIEAQRLAAEKKAASLPKIEVETPNA